MHASFTDHEYCAVHLIGIMGILTSTSLGNKNPDGGLGTTPKARYRALISVVVAACSKRALAAPTPSCFAQGTLRLK